MLLIEILQKAPSGGISAGCDCARRGEIADRVPGTERGALEFCWEEARTPVVDAGLGNATRIGNGNKGRQVLVRCSEGVSHPGSDTRKAVKGKAGRKEVLCGAVRIGVAGKGVHEGHLVDQFPKVRKHVGDHLAALPSRPELILRAGQIS